MIICLIISYVSQKNFLERNLELILYTDCTTIGFDLEYSPMFYGFKCHTNIKFFQYQYEKKIMEKIKDEFTNKASKI